MVFSPKKECTTHDKDGLETVSILSFYVLNHLKKGGVNFAIGGDGVVAFSDPIFVTAGAG